MSLYTVSDWGDQVYFNEKYYRLSEQKDTISEYHPYNQYKESITLDIKNKNYYKFRAGLNKDTVLVKVDSLNFKFLKMNNLEIVDSVLFEKSLGFYNANIEEIEFYNGSLFALGTNLNFFTILNIDKKKFKRVNFDLFFKKPIRRVRFLKTNNQLQIQTEQGLLIVNENLDILSKLIKPFFLENDVSRSLLDGQNNFWINTKNNGVFLLPDETNDIMSDLFINSTSDQIVDYYYSNKNIFICLESGKIKKYSINRLRRLKQIKINKIITGFVQNDDQFLIFNRDENFKSIDTSLELIPRILEDEPCNDAFIASDSSQDILKNPFGIGIKEGIFTENNSYFKSAYHLLKNNNASNCISTFKQKAVNRIFALNDTLFYTISNKIYQYREEEGEDTEYLEFENYILEVVVFDDKIILITSGGRIYEISKNVAKLIFETELEFSNFCMIDSKNLCLLTSNSIFKLDLKKQKLYKIIDVDYFSGSEFNRLKIFEDVIILSSNKGLHSINYKNLLKKRESPKIKFIKALSNGNYLSNGSKVDYFNNNIVLIYDLISFNSHGKQEISYKLYRNREIMSDFEIIEMGMIDLKNMTPGYYQVETQGIDTYGNKSNIEKFSFTVAKPFWQSLWFYLLVFICTAIIFYSVARKIIRKTEKRKDIEFKAKFKLAELELSALQSQLNPHFIFNAMGSIQGLLQVDKVDLADEYIAKFSRLMRRFLMSSKSKYIKLIHELEIIQDYIEIEKLRYNNFDFDIEIDPKIDVLSMEVPSLFIQPFVENAIAHGLFHKKGRGELKIFIVEQGEGVSIKIRDNGIGRVASKIINSKSVSNYKSYGMSLIKDRLATLNSISSVPYQFSIEDLAIGTQVNLWIPYNNKSAA